MSYRAAIGVQLPDNTIKAIYIDWGHPLSIPSMVNPNATPVGKYLQENCPTFGLALGIVNKEDAYVFDNLYQFTMDFPIDEIENWYLFRDDHWHIMAEGYWCDLTNVLLPEHITYHDEVQNKIDIMCGRLSRVNQ